MGQIQNLGCFEPSQSFIESQVAQSQIEIKYRGVLEDIQEYLGECNHQRMLTSIQLSAIQKNQHQKYLHLSPQEKKQKIRRFDLVFQQINQVVAFATEIKELLIKNSNIQSNSFSNLEILNNLEKLLNHNKKQHSFNVKKLLKEGKIAKCILKFIPSQISNNKQNSIIQSQFGEIQQETQTIYAPSSKVLEQNFYFSHPKGKEIYIQKLFFCKDQSFNNHPKSAYPEKYRLLQPKDIEIVQNSYNIQLNLGKYLFEHKQCQIDMQAFLSLDWSEVQWLVLVNCKINNKKWKQFSQQAQLFQNLQVLHIYGNQIQNVSEQDLNGFKRLKVIVFSYSIDSNPLSPKSKQNLERFMRKNSNVRINYKQIKSQIF